MEFLNVIMTLDSSNIDKLYAYSQDAKKFVLLLSVPDINLSDHDFSVNYENNLSDTV